MHKNLRRSFNLLTIIAILLTSLGSITTEARAASTIFINEIHYDNTGGDSGEGVEIAGPAGTDLTGWSLVPYDGSNGASYSTTALSGTISDQDNGYGTLFFAISGLQNGAPDGIALVDNTSAVVQFLSYEGSFTATDGPANGMASSDIGVSEASSSPVGQSLQMTGGPGLNDSDFSWAGSATASFGSVNTGQSFGAPLPPVVINEFQADPAADLTGDANGDGTRDAGQDEFVEIVNTSGADLDISGWTVSDLVGVRHTFPASTIIPADCNVVVFGGGTPTGTFANAVVHTASSGGLGLNNGGDTITINDGSSDVATYAYGSEGGNDQSSTRDPDSTGGSFVLHSTATGSGGALYSPGAKIDGTSFSGCTPPPSLVINEVHADPDATNGDANGDGTVDTGDDEFVELVNISGADLDVSGWVINDAGGLRHTFPANTIIPDDCNIVVFGGGTPTGTFGNALVQTASVGYTGFNNGGDTITVNDGSSDVATYNYGSEGGNNQSLTRDPDISGSDPLVAHSTATGSGGALYSPGTMINGSDFFGCSVLDTTAPMMQTLNPADNSTGVTVVTNLVISFDENVQKGTGNITIHLASDNSVVQTIDVTNVAVTVSGMDVTINPPSNLAASTEFYVNIPAGAIEDTSANDYAGITDATTWSFTTGIIAPTVLNNIVFNEVLPDPNSSTRNFDTDGDGVFEIADEFVEIFNTSSSPLDISGLQFWDSGSDNYLTVPGGTTLGANGFVVVVANIAGGSLPAVNAGSYAFSAGGGLSMSNGGDNLVLYDPITDEYIQAIYGGDGVDDPTSPPAGDYVGFSATATRLSAVLDMGNYTDGTSLALSPDGAMGNIVDHDTIAIAGTMATPGNPNVGAPYIDLELSQTIDDNNPNGGDTVTSTITVRNVSTSQAATNVVVRQYIPDINTEIGSIVLNESQGSSVLLTLDTVEWSVGNLAVGSSATLTTGMAIRTGIDGVSFDNEGEVWSVTEATDRDSTPGNMGAAPAEDDENSVTIYVGMPAACGTAATMIHDIQGTGSASAEDGNVHSIEGVVVGDFQTSAGLSGFFLQEEDADADANPASSEGIFVFDDAAPAMDVSVGDLVRVTGEVDEFYDRTEITNVTEVMPCGTGTATAATITLPVASLDVWEQHEGMLVNIPQTLYATSNYSLGQYGEVDLSINGKLDNPTNVAAPGAAANAVRELNDRSRIQLEDGRTVSNPIPAPYMAADNTLRTGDSIPSLTGVLNYAYSAYEVHPTGSISFTRVNARQVVPPAVGGTVKVASMNVLNYFTTIDTGSPACGPSGTLDCRGADTATELTRQRDKIVSAITAMDADVIGLMEVENSPIDAALNDLVASLNTSAGPGTYATISTGTIGTDAIKVALIYKPAAVTPLGAFAILDSSVDASFIDTKNRPVLAQSFTDNASGDVFTVAVNHLKSKGSDCDSLSDPDTGDGQGNCNLTRTSAATAEVNWLAGDPTGSGDPDFIIMGDLNAYAQEDPITAIKNGGYTNLIEQFLGVGASSYQFYGEHGTLDHALASASLTGKVTGVVEWHINGDEPAALDYNDYNQAYLYQPNAFRASDHDPVLIGLAMGATPPVVVFGANTVPADGASLTTGPTQILVEFNKDVLNDGSAGAANNTANFMLVESLSDGFQTVSCAAGPNAADTSISIDSAFYTNTAGFIATVGINGGVPLPVGNYRFFACGTTSITDLAGLELNGGLSDTVINFTVGSASELPATGFPQGAVTPLAEQPQNMQYSETVMMLEIPSLAVSTPIVGVPINETGWDITWLGGNAGYLDGTAFPTWNGNTVITGHVWDANNQPGPFANVKYLNYGDTIQIQAWGLTYTYEVRETKTVRPWQVNSALREETYDWVTLVTCEDYQDGSQSYATRRVIRAVLVDVR